MTSLVDSSRCGYDVRANVLEEDLIVSNFPHFDYSMRDVREAGKVIAGPLNDDDPNMDRVVWAFRVANNWRDAHAFPMRSIRFQLEWYARTIGLRDYVVAARLKRMQAIRRKLRRIGPGLNQIQDLGGCRVILPTVEGVSKFVEILSDRSRHSLRRSDNYIDAPKSRDGYRSHHLIFEYSGQGDASVYNGRRIEVQVRTRLQHSWATAVEAVGLFRGEDLKGNKGDEKWLRLFKLMSAEFSVTENCATPEGVPRREDRIKEIRGLDLELQASSTLENLTTAVGWTEVAVQSRERPSYYLIKYDNATSQVEVRPYFNPLTAVRSYDQAEVLDNESGTDTTNVVLVETGKIEQLKEAYPNYFGDVQLFRRNLKRISQGKSAKDFDLIPQERVRLGARERPDYDWLRRRLRWS